MCHRREWAQKSESAHKGEGRAGERPARTHVKRTWLKEGGLSSGASAQGPQCLVFGSLLLRHCCTVVTPVYCIADTRNPIKLPTATSVTAYRSDSSCVFSLSSIFWSQPVLRSSSGGPTRTVRVPNRAVDSGSC